ncbi:MAG: hypothetical protein VR72_13040 [Clostridiaceae bacterium BRH_c20a]|nr:MAG: hypothetical protein VR72_13040 [Clostridiaceae bacterium BRH_c20a]
MDFPKMIKVNQKLSELSVGDIPSEIRKQLLSIRIDQKVKSGESVAITVGSRGIRNIDVITKAVVAYLHELGVRPFVVPAMGSHGGATANGQKDVLAHYGVTEETVGAPVKATMEVLEIGKTEDNITVYMDMYAAKADHVLVMNRVKPHTDFNGDIESGLHKIMAIGLGKHKGAQYYHQAAVTHGLDRIIYTVGQTMLMEGNILCGLGIVENGHDETAILKGMLPEQFEESEKTLLKQSKKMFAALPFDDIDVLIIDQIGKNISGTGMDTNVVGRLMSIYSPDPELPRIKRIVVSDLTPETYGNALGIGAADFCNSRIIDKLDKKAMYTNAITGLCPEKARLPMAFSSDKEMLEAALKTIGFIAPEQAKVVHIKTTLYLEYLELSTAFEEEIRKRDDLIIIRGPEDIQFDTNDNFVFITGNQILI